MSVEEGGKRGLTLTEECDSGSSSREESYVSLESVIGASAEHIPSTFERKAALINAYVVKFQTLWNKTFTN